MNTQNTGVEMFDDNNHVKPAPDTNATPANDPVSNATISAPSVPAEDTSVAVPDPTMSSNPAQPPKDPQTTAPDFNPASVPEINADSSVSESTSNTAPSLSSSGYSPTVNEDEELIELKQKALKSLSPLLSHLDQTPEEKFRTTMMMIQASDDQSLVKTAYDAAQNITDEKSKAQALLDIVNEINYFTQNGKN